MFISISSYVGKTSTAIALAKHYQAALLTIDGVVCDAIANGNTQAGLKARELCSLAARKLSEDQGNQETVDGEKKITNFSVEAVAAHTQGIEKWQSSFIYNLS